MAIIQQEDLSKVRAEHPDAHIVFCSGSFDLLHPGHVEFLETCKGFGDCLVVAVGNDKAIRKFKGNLDRPVMDQRARLKMIDSLRAVDYCYLDTISRSAADLVRVLACAFCDLKPQTYVVCDDAFDMETRRVRCAEHGVLLRVLPKKKIGKFSDMSTTSIIKSVAYF